MRGVDTEIRLIYSETMLTKQDIKSIALLLQTQKEEILLEMEKKFTVHDKEILKGIAEYIQDELIPLFDDYESRIKHLERHTNHPPAIL